MSAITPEEVARLAGLARIELRPAELDRLAGQLGVILDAVAQVQEVAGEDVPATSHPIPLTNVTRPDEPRPGLTAAEVLVGRPRGRGAALLGAADPGGGLSVAADDLTRRTAAELADALAAKEVSSVEVTRAHLDRIAAVDG